MQYSIEPKDQVIVKGYGFQCLRKKIAKSISKNLNGKCSRKLLDHAKQSSSDALKATSKRVIKNESSRSNW